MRRIERNEERGKSELGWLHSRFTYSFAEYLNPNRMGFGALRVVNHDIIEAGKGFPLHHHEQMEIVTLMLSGTLTHEDSMGNKRELQMNEVQVMTAGTGVNHGEWNHSTGPVELLQIWVYPKERALMPQYAERAFLSRERNNRLQVLVSGIKKEDALFIHQDAVFYRARIEVGSSIPYSVSSPANGVFIFVISGTVAIDGDALLQHDSIEISGESSFVITATSEADVLLIEVPLA